jgi:membrane associated rhomboid family serine protease
MHFIDGFFGRRAGPNGARPGGGRDDTGADDGPDGDPAPEPPSHALLRAPDRGKAREWALVLQSQEMPHDVEHDDGGWAVRVPAELAERARAAVKAYERENVGWPPVRPRDEPRHPRSEAVPLVFALLVAFYYLATGPAASHSHWFDQGRADALLLWREPWRMVTALTLHGDAGHVLGNAVSGSIFGTMVARRLGPGAAVLALVVGGALGNAVNALYHLPEGHRSIGASTAVFAAVGVLAGVQTILSGRRRERARLEILQLLAPVVGGLALLGALGAAPQSDLGAHAFGFGAGLVVGLGTALFGLRRPRGPRSRPLQHALLSLAALFIAASWLLATRG